MFRLRCHDTSVHTLHMNTTQSTRYATATIGSGKAVHIIDMQPLFGRPSTVGCSKSGDAAKYVTAAPTCKSCAGRAYLLNR